jgi:glycosyltransferase involved in cell wall biosynthesis
MTTSPRHAALQNKSLYISCVVPVFNEEANVEEFFKQLHLQLQALTNHYEIVAIDDGSRDQTVAIITTLPASYNIKLLCLSRNFGKENALTAGLEHCSGEVVIMIDADFQHPLATIPVFLENWANGYEMVYGVRENRDNESSVKRGFARIFYWLMAKITQIDIPNNAGDFRLLDRKVVNSINSMPERSRFMKGLYAWVGYKKIAIPFKVQDRTAGKSAWGLRRLTELAITGITSFSDIPLRVWGFIGFLISLVSIIYAIYIVTVTLLYGADLPGFPSIIVAVMFFGGIQLLSIGILGEYIARIFSEVKQRPQYIVEKKYGFED